MGQDKVKSVQCDSSKGVYCANWGLKRRFYRPVQLCLGIKMGHARPVPPRSMKTSHLARNTAEVKESIFVPCLESPQSVSERLRSLFTTSCVPKNGFETSTKVEGILSRIDQQAGKHANLGGVLRSMDSGKLELYSCFHRQLKSQIAAKALTLKVLNLCLTKYHFLSRSSTLVSKPFGLLVDPCNGCNLACPGCVHSNRARALNVFQWKPGIVAPARVSEFLHRYGPTGIQTLFCNYGEPLLNPDTSKYIRWAKGYLMKTWLSTSLSVPHFDPSAYVASGLDYISLSIDGATQSTYERYRRNGDLGLVFRNLRGLVDAKVGSGKRTPRICWQYLAFEHNMHEISLAIEIARDLGVDEFRIARPFDVSWDDPETRAANVQSSIQLFNVSAESDLFDNWIPFCGEIDSEAIEMEFDASWIDRVPKGYLDRDRAEVRCAHTCQWLYKDITMDAHGRIFPCAGAPKVGSSAFLFSELETGKRREEPFNCEKYLRARQFFADPKAWVRNGGLENGNDDPYCANCDWIENQKRPDIGNEQAEQYLKSVGLNLFSEESCRILCAW